MICGSKEMPLPEILKLQVAKDAISCILQSVTENEVFMIIKLDLASNAVSPFWIIYFFFCRELDVSVSKS